MTHEELETIYTAVALKIDEVGPEQTELFLAKLVILLSHKFDNPDEVKACIDRASTSLMS